MTKYEIFIEALKHYNGTNKRVKALYNLLTDEEEIIFTAEDIRRLNSKKQYFTKKELFEIIDKELSKPDYKEINMEIVDICLESIDKGFFYETIEEAEKLRNSVIYIDRNDVSLPEGRYFIDDLIGCNVTDADTGNLLGKISDISETGANDVWHITNNGKEYLVPAIDEVIVSVNVEEKSAVLRPMKGIFDDED